MARVLIVGGGCRGRTLAGRLAAAGHAVRITTRDPGRGAVIEAAGAEAFIGDPDVIGTLMASLAGVTVVCWLLGTAAGRAEDVAPLHGTRLRFFLERTVDTPVRAVVYEAAGTVPPAVLAAGRAAVEAAHDTWQIPVAVLESDPSDADAWLAEAGAALDGLLGP